MALLQPSDVPSMAGINSAITSTVDAHASTTDVNGPHYDSGWIDVTFRTGFTFSGESVRYRRIGHAVYIRGRVARTPSADFAANTQYTVADIPAGFRPNPLVMFAAAGSNGTNSGGRFWVNTSGEIIVQPEDAVPSIPVACAYLND
jgi:hypothetical protein